MNILPKSFSQFKEKQYWNSFFKNLKSTHQEYFQWYGAYEDFRNILPKLLANCSSIFNVGCGKSTFAEDLYKEYPKLSITSCDYSQQVIQDMIKRTKSLKMEALQYHVCDLLKDLPEQYVHKFDIVFDKGTLDAILPEDQLANIQKIKNIYFENMEKCLTNNEKAKYLIVSMLQPHVLKTILGHFWNKKCSINIYECLIKQSTMQPFLVSIEYDNCEIHKKQLHVLNGQSKQFTQIEQVMKQIRMIQLQVEYGVKSKKLSPGQHLQFSVYDKNKKIRYILQVIDHQNKKHLQKNTCSVFIAPQGKQNSFLYGTERGLQMLHSQINSSRLIVVKLIIGNIFESLQQVKQQLNELIPSLIQKQCNYKEVPYLTDGDQLGQRQYLYDDQSIIIEEVIIDEEAFRRLVIKDNLAQVQSQYKLTYCFANPKNQHLKKMQSKTHILPVKKNCYTCIDKQYIDQGYYRVTAAGIMAFLTEKSIQQGVKMLFLGGGGCCIPKFLFDHCENLDITIIQLNKSIVSVCRQYFELPEEQEGFKIIQGDAYEYIMKLSEQQKFDVIVLDINGQDGQSSPPPQFLSQQFMTKVSKIIEPNNGLFVAHIIRADPPSLQAYFNPIYAHQNDMELVTVIFCEKKQVRTKIINDQQMTIIHKDQLKIKPRNKKFELFGWQNEIARDIKLIQPKVGGIFRNTKVYIEQEGNYINDNDEQLKQDTNKAKKKKNKKKR